MLVALVLSSTVKIAQGQTFAEFKATVISANQHFDKKNYELARKQYQHAYRLRSEPLLLYNIAQCYRKQGELVQAVQMYLRYLETPTPDPITPMIANTRAQASKHIQTIQEQLREINPPKATPLASPAPQKQQKKSLIQQPSPDSQLVLSRRRSHPLLPAGAWISWGVSATALSVSGVLALLGRQAEKDHRDQQTQKSADRVEKLERAINISLLTAGTTAAIGLIWYLRHRANHRSHHSPLSPTVGILPARRGASAVLQIEF